MEKDKQDIVADQIGIPENFKVKGGDGRAIASWNEVEGCGHKIKYDGTLKDLYLTDYQKFYEYNVRDVDLCKRIDDKWALRGVCKSRDEFFEHCKNQAIVDKV